MKNKKEKKAGSIGDIFNIKLAYNNVSMKTLQSYGDLPIEFLELRRHPLSGAIHSALKFITGGKVPFDKLYHLSLVATVKGGTKIIIEKNEVVNITANFSTDPDDEHLTIPSIKDLTVSHLLEKTRLKIGDEVFFSYSAFFNNCQIFLKLLLSNVGLYTKEANDFVYQDLNQLIKHTPLFVQKLTNAITHVASVYNKLSGGAPSIESRINHLINFMAIKIKENGAGYSLTPEGKHYFNELVDYIGYDNAIKSIKNARQNLGGKRGVPWPPTINWLKQLKLDIAKTGYKGSWQDAMLIKDKLRIKASKKIKKIKKPIKKKGFMEFMPPSDFSYY